MTTRAQDLWARYKLTLDQYDEMLKAQDGLCTICEQPETAINPRNGKVINLAVDHDHNCCSGRQSCGKCNRGLLCNACNRILTHFERKVKGEQYLYRVLSYLKRDSVSE